MWPTTNTTVSPLETTDTTDDDSLRLTTISTNKHEVANGFVKNGSSLPYVYETNDSGLSKVSNFCHLSQYALLQETGKDPPK